MSLLKEPLLNPGLWPTQPAAFGKEEQREQSQLSERSWKTDCSDYTGGIFSYAVADDLLGRPNSHHCNTLTQLTPSSASRSEGKNSNGFQEKQDWALRLYIRVCVGKENVQCWMLLIIQD